MFLFIWIAMCGDIVQLVPSPAYALQKVIRD